jgi:hypothetical protein
MDEGAQYPLPKTGASEYKIQTAIAHESSTIIAGQSDAH